MKDYVPYIPTSPWTIIVKEGKRCSYWIQSPIGGYMQLPKSEVLHAIQMESAVLHKPTPKQFEKIGYYLTRPINSDPAK